MKFGKLVPISYRASFQPKRDKRQRRTGYVLPVLCSEAERETANATAWRLRAAIGGAARVGESDESVDVYVMDTPMRDAADVLKALVEALR